MPNIGEHARCQPITNYRLTIKPAKQLTYYPFLLVNIDSHISFVYPLVMLVVIPYDPVLSLTYHVQPVSTIISYQPLSTIIQQYYHIGIPYY